MNLNRLQQKLVLADVLALLLGLILAWYTDDDGGLDTMVLVGLCVLLVISNVKNIIKYCK